MHPSFLRGHELYVQTYRMFSFLKQKRRQRLLVSFALLLNSDRLQVNSNGSSPFFVDRLIVFHRFYCKLHFNLFFPSRFRSSSFCLFSPVFYFFLTSFFFPHISPRPYKYSTRIPLFFRQHCWLQWGLQLEETSLETLTARNCCKAHRSAVTSREVKYLRVHSCTTLHSTSLPINISIYTRLDFQSVYVYTHIKF